MSTVTKLSDRQLTQDELDLSRKPKHQELLALSEVRHLAELVEREEVKGWEAVFKRAITDSGLFDSEIADSLEMDKGQLSKTLAAGNLQTRRIERFNRAVGNRIILQVWNYRAGFEMKPLLSETERKLAETEKENLELKNELAAITKFMKKIK
ncbi:MAG: hypothetical protein JAY90_20075 [Candidatus Thiodiazotropha lotti]|nr:hypothetical protein [Candidatus Thiodiazotropha lotti]